MACITALADEIVQLIENNPDFLPVLDYAAGALLSLREAEHYRFVERPGPCAPDYREQVARAVTRMRDGEMPDADFWIAGWHFNSALVRIAASYDRAKGAFKRQCRSRGAELVIVVHNHAEIDKIRAEVEDLKHEPEGNTPSREVRFSEALDGLKELLDFIAAQQTALR